MAGGSCRFPALLRIGALPCDMYGETYPFRSARPVSLLRPLLACLTALVLAVSPARAGQENGQVTVFAAASLKTALDRIGAEFEAATGHGVRLVLAGSSTLARQIQAGAPADVFLSANLDWMDALAADGLIDPETRFDLAGNRLVLIAPRGADGKAAPLALGPGTDLVARLDGGRLATALTDAVPAGVYAKAALTGLGLWEQVRPHLAQTDNVRAALALVALGETPMGVVYATDAAAEPRVGVIATFPAGSHPPIVYPAARIAGRASPAADAFLAWLKGPEARAALADQGFEVKGDALRAGK